MQHLYCSLWTKICHTEVLCKCFFKICCRDDTFVSVLQLFDNVYISGCGKVKENAASKWESFNTKEYLIFMDEKIISLAQNKFHAEYDAE